MPDQPDDPIHYDMKIPPEPHPSEHEDDSSQPSADNPVSSAGGADRARDVNVPRGDDKPQSGR